MQAGENNGKSDAAEKGGDKSDVRDPAQVRSADFLQVGENYAHNQGSLDPFTQRDCKGFEHFS